MPSSPRVFTIPASAPFLPTLIKAFNDGTLVQGFSAARDPLALASATLYLPTRRACRLAREVFLEKLDGDAAILPRIVALGDIDEDEIAFAEAAAGDIAADALALPPTLDGLERRLLLARLVEKWAASPEVRTESGSPLVASTPAAALALADDLARLIDDMTTREVSWERLDKLVPDNLDPNIGRTHCGFCKSLATIRGLALLDERHAIEPAERRDRLIKAEAARLARKTDGPVIAAGSTGSIPATAALIATIAHLPHGAVVLPGLDTDLDADSWRLIAGEDKPDGVAAASGHPQFAMQALLARIEIDRDGVEVLANATGRERLLSEAMRPSATTDLWRERFAEADFRVMPMPRSKACHASKPPTPRKRRSPSRSRCAKRSSREKPLRWSRLTARLDAACMRRSRAGTSRPTIPAATRSLRRRGSFRQACGGGRARRA